MYAIRSYYDTLSAAKAKLDSINTTIEIKKDSIR